MEFFSERIQTFGTGTVVVSMCPLSPKLLLNLKTWEQNSSSINILGQFLSKNLFGLVFFVHVDGKAVAQEVRAFEIP